MQNGGPFCFNEGTCCLRCQGDTKMTMTPVDLQSDGSHSGLVADDAAALALARSQYSGSEWDQSSIKVRLTDREIGHT